MKKLVILLWLKMSSLCLLRTLALSTYYDRVYPPVDKSDNSTTHIYIGLMVSLTGERLNSSGNVAGVRVALDLINQDPHMLPGYTLHYVLSDSQCNRTVASKAFLEQILNEPIKVALVGAGCSVATEPVAELSSYFNISQFSCSSASHLLANRNRFPYYFQLLPTIADIAPVYDVLSEQFSWNHFVFIVENENLFTVQLKRTLTLFDQRGVSYSVNTFNSAEGITSLERLPFENPDDRIFVINSYQKHALDFLCEAAKHNIKSPTHVLMFYAWYEAEWWKSKSASCTVEERVATLYHSLAVDFIVSDLLFEINSTTVGINGTEYYEKENQLRGNFGENLFSQYCFDATWAFAFALNATLNGINADPALKTRLAEEYGNADFTLASFSYHSDLFLQEYFQRLNNPGMSFEGVTGNVAFDENGIRIANLLSVHQFRSGKDALKRSMLHLTEVGRVLSPSSNSSLVLQYSINESSSTLWPGGVPSDGVVQRRVVTVLVPVTIVFSILASAGILFTLVCLAFNFFLRNRKLVRLTSPNLNYFILFGSLLFYIDVYFYVLPTTNSQLQQTRCIVTTWLTALGYSFTFGPIVAKMFRIWYIFRRTSVKIKVVNDWKLSLLVLALVAFDLVLLTIYNAVESFGDNEPALIPSREFSGVQVGEVPIIRVSYVCSSLIRDIISGVFFGYKALVQLAALILAFMTRKVKVKGLDDSKFIAAIIYMTSIILVVIFVCSYTLKEYINIFAAVLSTGILVEATCVLGLIFVPKMVGLYRDPKGDKIFEQTTATTVLSANDSSVESLKQRITELETMVETLTKSP